MIEINYGAEVADAIRNGRPVVALESTVIAHGLPQPRNLETGLKLEHIIREAGAVPATIAVFDGVFTVGLSNEQIERLAAGTNIRKISRRDLPIAAAKRLDCATTVATTAFAAQAAGIKVFATGGIGGVHRGEAADVSADLPELARTPIVVVCSGAKIVLDLPATREWLETHGVTILGWKFDELPGFYVRSSGLSVDERVDSADEVAAIADARDEMALSGAILVAVPVPDEFALESVDAERILDECLVSLTANSIRGKNVTPYLLEQFAERSGGKSLEANIALLENNARIAAEIAIAMKR